MEQRFHLRLQVQPHRPFGQPGRQQWAPRGFSCLPVTFFGISTARTGGGKYVPEDIRFQSL